MPEASRPEFYFIFAMMILILAICTVACIAFFKTYKKEMREKKAREMKKQLERDPNNNGA